MQLPLTHSSSVKMLLEEVTAMKKEYIEPQMEIKKISFEDILTTSGDIPTTPPEGDQPDIWE